MGLFDKLLKKGNQNDNNTQPNVSMAAVVTDAPNYKVAGVTFNNDDGESRQKIISKLKVNDKLHFVKCEYEGETAIAIFTDNKKQVGFVKKGNISRTLKYAENEGHGVVTKCNKGVDTGNWYLMYKLKD